MQFTQLAAHSLPTLGNRFLSLNPTLLPGPSLFLSPFWDLSQACHAKDPAVHSTPLCLLSCPCMQ